MLKTQDKNHRVNKSAIRGTQIDDTILQKDIAYVHTNSNRKIMKDGLSRVNFRCRLNHVGVSAFLFRSWIIYAVSHMAHIKMKRFYALKLGGTLSPQVKHSASVISTVARTQSLIFGVLSSGESKHANSNISHVDFTRATRIVVFCLE